MKMRPKKFNLISVISVNNSQSNQLLECWKHIFMEKNIKYEWASNIKNDETGKKLELLNIDDVDKQANSDRNAMLWYAMIGFPYTFW